VEVAADGDDASPGGGLSFAGADGSASGVEEAAGDVVELTDIGGLGSRILDEEEGKDIGELSLTAWLSRAASWSPGTHVGVPPDLAMRQRGNS
jgi:hypothetical protein